MTNTARSATGRGSSGTGGNAQTDRRHDDGTAPRACGVKPTKDSLFRILSDTVSRMFVILRSEEFDTWLSALADPKGKARIVARLRSAQLGNLGDCGPVGEGVSEMRVHVGPGYRV